MLAYAVTGRGVVRSFELPSLRARSERSIDAASRGGAYLAAAPPETALIAVGGEGAEPIVILDARTLADVHTYRPEKPTAVAALVAVPERASFLVGLAQPQEPAEVWELAYSSDAPPVYRGLVHDYRMGEAIPLPGRFTPRVSPVASTTSDLRRGPMPYEWLRIDTSGRVTVLHLEVRREIGRLPEDGEGDREGPWLTAAWEGPGARGWLVGRPGSRAIRLFESGSWRLSRPIALPAPLLDIRSSSDRRLTIVAVGDGQQVELLRIEDGMARATGRQASLFELPLRLSASRDGRCIALFDASNEWLGSELLH